MLFTSYQENCPLAPLEAAAAGIPVIFRNIKEYELLYENPYLKASNTSEFVALTRRLINDKAFYSEGVNISSKLVKQFDRNEIRNKLIAVYTRLIHHHSANTLRPSGNIVFHK
jgi:1,2-diacylglycerol-3-alpha-glucose alpha-1,2-galactosyltransferase